MSIREVVYDAPNHRYYVTLESTMDGERFVAVGVGHIGREAIFNIWFYSLKSEWPQYESVAASLHNSFSFTPGKGYVPPTQQALRTPDRSGSQTTSSYQGVRFARVLAFAALAGVFGLCRTLKNKSKGKVASENESPPAA